MPWKVKAKSQENAKEKCSDFEMKIILNYIELKSIFTNIDVEGVQRYSVRVKWCNFDSFIWNLATNFNYNVAIFFFNKYYSRLNTCNDFPNFRHSVYVICYLYNFENLSKKIFMICMLLMILLLLASCCFNLFSD